MCRTRTTCLDKPRPPVQVQVQILDLANVAEGVVQVILSGLLMQASDQDDPALNSCADLRGGSSQRTPLRRQLGAGGCAHILLDPWRSLP
eukprot:scaffold2376_cov115-Isochrysis_galbana.AAC.6